jgi:fibronectin type 3 domain-containing protein
MLPAFLSELALKFGCTRKARRSVRKASRSRLLCLEALEDRDLPSSDFIPLFLVGGAVWSQPLPPGTSPSTTTGTSMQSLGLGTFSSPSGPESLGLLSSHEQISVSYGTGQGGISYNVMLFEAGLMVNTNSSSGGGHGHGGGASGTTIHQSAPATPTGLTATAGNAQVALNWSSSSGATSYNIYRSTTSGGEGSTPYKTGVTSTSFTDSGLTNGTTYYYEVSAVNSAGQSPVSSQVSATPHLSVPPTPTGLTATSGNTQVALNWSSSSGATSYNIYRSTTSGGEGSTPYQTGVTSTSFTDTGLTNGTTYYYEVSAVNAAGQSPVSSQVSATPQVSVPPTPTGLTATSGNAQVALNWSSSLGATSYNIYRSTTSGGEGSTPYQTGVTSTSFTDSSLTNGTTYYYEVSAVNAAGQSPVSSQVSATPATPPATPTGLTATAGNAQVALNWSASSGAASYNIYRSTTSGGEGSTPYQTGVTSTSFTDSSLTNGTTYYYEVSAVNAAGQSPVSSQVSATPVAPPATPAGLTATAGNAQVALNWSSSSGATSYNIYRSTTSGGEGSTPYQTGVTSTSFTDSSLTNGTTYYYEVSAVNAGGQSPVSSQVSATPVAPPATPTGLTATSGNTQVALNWSASSGATSYNIYRSTTSGGEGSTPYKTGVTSTSFTDTGLTNGTTYYYEVSAVNAGGQSAVSSQVSATPQLSVPPTPTGLTATAGNAQVALSWSASSGATSYDIYRSTTSGGEGSTPYQTGVTSTSFTDTGLTNGTTYYYEVSAVNAAGQSPVSSETSATPQASSGLILLPSSELASLQQQAASNTSQWQAFKSNLDQHLNTIIGSGLGNDGGSYEASELTWIADYSLGYQVLKSSDPTTAAAYAGKAIALIESGLNDAQVAGWTSIQYLARGNGSTTTFTLPNSNIISSTLGVYEVPVRTIAVVRGNSSTDTIGDNETILKISNTPDGNADYVGGTDWSTGAAAPGGGHDGTLPNQGGGELKWLSGGKQPTAGSTYYVTETSGVTAWQNGPVGYYTLNGNTITFNAAPSAGQAVFVQYLYNTPSLEYQQTSAGDGGFNSIQVDAGYTTRYLAYIPLGLDWLSGFSGLSPQLVTQADNLLVQWSNYISTSGYHYDAPGSNYGAGEYFQNALTALYLDGRVSAGTQLMSNLVSWRQTYLLPVLQDTGTGGLNGGFWPEGWNYGWEATSDLILASVALEEGGYINATPEHTWASQVVDALISAQPAANELYDGGQWYNYPTRFLDKDLFYVLSATASSAAEQSYANYIVQNYPASDFIEGNNTNYNNAYTYQGMLFGNPSAPASYWSSLPLQHFSSGSGLLTARSDWGTSGDDPNATWMSVQMGNFLTLDHQTLTPGQVQIQRGSDDLLVNGAAVGQDGNWPWANMGNIVIVNAGSAQSNPGQPGYWYGTPGIVVNAYEAAGNHTYISGNLTASYNNDPSSGLPNPVSQLTREVVYLNPNYVIVYDRVTTTQASYTKEQQWNFSNAPTVTGNAFVEAVGSSKLFGQTFSTTPLTLTVHGTQAGSATIQQLEIQNASPTASVNYLTAFQVAPSTTTSMDATEHVLTTDGRMEGTQMGNQLVLFGVASGAVNLTTPVTYSVSGSSSVSNLLVDLQAGGVYQVVAGGTNLGNFTASSQGTLSFTTPAGAQQVTVTRVG